MKAIIILFLFVRVSAFAQHQQRTLFIYNVAFGGISSGIGAIINKPKKVKRTNAFIRGLWQGSVGGLLNYSGKKTLYLIDKNQNSIYAWPAKILHAAGTSIIENAALYAPFLQNWNIDFGLVRFDFSFKKNMAFKARLLPEAIFATIMAGSNGKFDLSTSLITGQIIFKSKKVLDLPNTSPAEGATFGRAIIYVESDQSFYTKGKIVSHELVHRFQYNEYQVFNAWLKPIGDKVRSKTLNNIFSKYVYFDFPYAFIPYYIDGQHSSQHFYRNFYEFEAESFSSNKHVYR